MASHKEFMAKYKAMDKTQEQDKISEERRKKTAFHKYSKSEGNKDNGREK